MTLQTNVGLQPSSEVGTPGATDTTNANIKGFALRMMALVKRFGMNSMLGNAFNGMRNYYQSFGWPTTITLDDIWARYERGGISQRITHAFPDGIWAAPPQVYVKDNDEWNQAWDALVEKLDLWANLHLLDVMTGMGQYAVLYMGMGGNSEGPAQGELSFVRAYSQRNAVISDWITDQNNLKCGLPKAYTLRMAPEKVQNDGSVVGRTGMPQSVPVGVPISTLPVNEDRILHVTLNSLENSVYGRPVYVGIWNYLLDLDKVVGSSAESYWLQAFPGLHANVDKEVDLTPEDAKDLSDEVDEYMHGMRRFVRTRGVDVQAINASQVDPSKAADLLLTLISSTTGIPKRILVGSEAGQLASTQDRANWADRLQERRSLHSEPKILRPFIKWCIDHNVMPDPGAKVQVLWPDAYRQSPLERGQTAAQTARTLTNVARAMNDREGLITDDEARIIIGLSTDQAMLAARPTESGGGFESEQGNRPPSRNGTKDPAPDNNQNSSGNQPTTDTPPTPKPGPKDTNKN